MKNRGFGLLENIIAIAIFSIVLLGFVSALSTLAITEIKNRLRSDAAQASREAVEIVYHLSQKDWDPFSSSFDSTSGQVYQLQLNGPDYELVPGSQILSNERLTREIMITPVYRDDNGVIVDSGGNLDVNTMAVTTRVYWDEVSDLQEVTYTTYLTNLGAVETP